MEKPTTDGEAGSCSADQRQQNGYCRVLKDEAREGERGDVGRHGGQRGFDWSRGERSTCTCATYAIGPCQTGKAVCTPHVMIIWASRSEWICQSGTSACNAFTPGPLSAQPCKLVPSQPLSASSSPPRPTSPFLLPSPRPQASCCPGVTLAHRECISFSSFASYPNCSYPFLPLVQLSP